MAIDGAPIDFERMPEGKALEWLAAASDESNSLRAAIQGYIKANRAAVEAEDKLTKVLEVLGCKNVEHVGDKFLNRPDMLEQFFGQDGLSR